MDWYFSLGIGDLCLFADLSALYYCPGYAVVYLPGQPGYVSGTF